MLLVLFLAGCKATEVQKSTETAPAQAQQAQPTAMEIARILKDAGIPFLGNVPGYKELTYPMDSSPGTPGSFVKVGNDASILSEATTATANSDIHITVFSSRDKLEQAQKRVEAMDHRTQRDKDLKLGFTDYYVELGCIAVTLSPDGGKPNKMSADTLRLSRKSSRKNTVSENNLWAFKESQATAGLPTFSLHRESMVMTIQPTFNFFVD